MKTLNFLIAVLAFTVLNRSIDEKIVGDGQQPQPAVDATGVIRVIYGAKDTIYCATSRNNGKSFSEGAVVGIVEDMHLGMSRGPQVASSKNYTMVSAIDKKGTIHSFQLDHRSSKWTKTAIINDIANSAPEGLMEIAAGPEDDFYAVWLDIREDRHNKIAYSFSRDQGKSWSQNQIVYRSPDETVCECCKPSIYATASTVYIMFRNWLDGSRDLYWMEAQKDGGDFRLPQKLGSGTWKLDGCPMDGGGLIVDENAVVRSVWQREGKIFYAEPGKEEQIIGEGRNCDLSDPADPFIFWQDGRELKLKRLSNGEEYHIGSGAFVKAIVTDTDKILCVWENNGRIEYRTL